MVISKSFHNIKTRSDLMSLSGLINLYDHMTDEKTRRMWGTNFSLDRFEGTPSNATVTKEELL